MNGLGVRIDSRAEKMADWVRAEIRKAGCLGALKRGFCASAAESEVERRDSLEGESRSVIGESTRSRTRRAGEDGREFDLALLRGWKSSILGVRRKEWVRLPAELDGRE